MSEQKRRPSISISTHERLVSAASGPAGLDCEPREARAKSTEELIEVVLDSREDWRESALEWQEWYSENHE